jgi:hypothetical protein
MITKILRQILSSVTCLTTLVLGAPGPSALAFQDQTPAQTSSTPSSTAPTAAPLTSDQLDALVAPIALYPDALVAQVLGAATFPDQLAIADYWVGQNKSLTGTALQTAVDQQSWDASVKALTQFPSVLDDMAKNLAWTSSLGQAFESQQADVMTAVQAMRAKAQAAGTLQSTPQVKVVQQDPQTIVIQPANPQVVYVPQYNPAVVYGSPTVVPLYTPPVAVAAATVSFGAGVAIGAAIGGGIGVVGGGFSWGFSSWNCNWGGGGGGGNIVFRNNTYISNNNWHSGYYNGYHPWGPGPHGPGPYGPHPYNPNGYGPHPYGPNGYGPHPYNPNYVPTRDQPNGGRNGDHGLIGGNGGVQHLPENGQSQRAPGVYNPRPEDRGSPGTNQRGNQWAGQRGNDGGRPWAQQPRSHMTGNGPRSIAESNRGRASMNRGGMRPQAHPAARPQVAHNTGGARRR